MSSSVSTSFTYGKPETLERAQQFVDLCGEAFAFDAGPWRAALERDGWGGVRVLTEGDGIAAGLVIHPTAQWFGEQRVLCHAIAGVVTAAQHRRRGAGKAVMLHMLREARQNAVPLTALYGSTPTFYRSVGYEPAGYRCIFSAELGHLPPVPPEARFMPIPVDAGAIRALYRDFAVRQSGCLDRTDHFWRQCLKPDDGSKRHVYGVWFGDLLEGYVTLAHNRPDGALRAHDVVCASARAARAILGFMGQHSSVIRSVVFPDGPQGPLHKQISENRVRPAHGSIDQWMLRITDVPAALGQRGYPPIDMELHLDVHDDTMPENAGRYVLRVARGRGGVEHGGAGTIQLDVRALTAIYTGFAHPNEMRDAGLLSGPSDALLRMGLVFVGPQPFMLDNY